MYVSCVRLRSHWISTFYIFRDSRWLYIFSFSWHVWPEIGTNQSTESTERRVYHMITCKLTNSIISTFLKYLFQGLRYLFITARGSKWFVLGLRILGSLYYFPSFWIRLNGFYNTLLVNFINLIFCTYECIFILRQRTINFDIVKIELSFHTIEQATFEKKNQMPTNSSTMYWNM